MSKRFVDTNLWEHPWFRKLTPKGKAAWLYLLTKCDHAGVWIVDFEQMSFNVNEPITAEEIEGMFHKHVAWLDSGKKLFIRDFVKFQYGVLKPTNNAHLSVIGLLEQHGIDTTSERKLATEPKKPGAREPLTRGTRGDQDKDKDIYTSKQEPKKSEEVISEFLPAPQLVEAALKKISTKTQKLWLERHPDPGWIKTEISKCLEWFSERKPVDKRGRLREFNAPTMSRWLESNWDKRVPDDDVVTEVLGPIRDRMVAERKAREAAASA